MAFSHPLKCFLEFYTANVGTPVPRTLKPVGGLDVVDVYQNFAKLAKSCVKRQRLAGRLRQIELLDLPDTWIRPHTRSVGHVLQDISWGRGVVL